ncbi:MAG: hypothetical protein JRG80_11880 [Deltaproteobacteria bacterium]|nr:hypothetical protein [Deltaproteobacteria bacterium]MBW2399957.1 hypothetical protein [Deltaproteobacteria bacterium]
MHRFASTGCWGCIFEIESGKIKAWRDYFDLTTYQRDLG